MRLQKAILGLAATALTVGGAFAQGADDPANADVLTAGAGTFTWDTTNCSDTGTFATTGTAVSSCDGSEDVWFSWAATASTNYFIDLCGSTMDTEIAIWDGNPNAGGQEIGCNDDSCGVQSGLNLAATAGQTYYIQVAYWSSVGGVWGSGPGTIVELPPPPSPPSGCLTTLFSANNGGNSGGIVYFDLTAVNATTIEALEVNTTSTGQIGLEIYTVPGTYLGNEGNPGAWTLVAQDNGNAFGLGTDNPSAVNLLAPWNIAPGTIGVAIQGLNTTTGQQMDHDYTNGNGANQSYTDGNLTLDLGAADNIPFNGVGFSPRVWNGSLCTMANGGSSGIGSPYCPGVMNSTGNPGVLEIAGSAVVASNDVTLNASGLPNNQFGFFLNSMTQGFSPMPGGSQGNLCLSGNIGRYNTSIFNTMGTGSASLMVDLTMTPTPSGNVAIATGETWNFQGWYRDAGGNSNFTNGVEVNFN